MSRWAIVPLVLASCTSAATHPAIEPAPNSGAVSAKLIDDPNAAPVQLAPGEEYLPPQLAPHPTPEYPPALLPLNLRPHTVVVRVTFDEMGRPTAIVPSPVASSTDDQYRPVFEAAVRDAVSRWKCWAPRIRKFRPGPVTEPGGKPDYRILVSEKVFKTFFDVAFSFEVVEGKPIVRRAQ